MIHAKYKKEIFREAAKTSHLTYQIGELDSLRKKSDYINTSDIKSKKVQSVILKLKKTLIEYRKLTGKGRGVAAIQIGISLRIAVVFTAKDKEIITIINPKIVSRSKELFSYPEICMSANPIIAKVVRPAFIKFEYFDEDGNKGIWDDPGNMLMNRVFQHEIDHMEGIVNIDLVSSKNLILNSDPLFFKNAKFEKA